MPTRPCCPTPAPKLDQLTHSGVQVREGDIYHCRSIDDSADLVLMHQVLHYLQDPQSALIEAGRILEPEGRLLVADFAPHDLDFLREEFAHERLGFSDGQMRQWMHEAGLEVVRHESLEPEPTKKDGQLTVSLWIAAKSNAAPLNTNRAGWCPRTGGGRMNENRELMRRSRLLGTDEIDVSFEFFPPKNEKMEASLWAAVERLEPLGPEFVSVTYGAGGSTRERTHATVARILRETVAQAGRTFDMCRRAPCRGR